jgi:histidine triad (HIT) family protein
MNDCLFCKIAQGDLDSQTVYEDNDFIAFLDVNPVTKGHTLLIPKQHCRNLLDFPTDMETDFVETAKKVANGVVEATNAEGFNLVMNNEKAAGQAVFHAHFHIIPRFPDEHRIQWDKTEYDDGELPRYGEQIAKHIRD